MPLSLHTIAGVCKNIRSRFVVYDPVMVSTSGRKLMTEDTMRTHSRGLFPLCSLITPIWAKHPAPFKSRYGYRGDETGCSGISEPLSLRRTGKGRSYPAIHCDVRPTTAVQPVRTTKEETATCWCRMHLFRYRAFTAHKDLKSCPSSQSLYKQAIYQR